MSERSDARPRARRRVAVVAGALAVTLVLGVVGVALMQRTIVFVPDRSEPPPVQSVLPGARDVELRTSDGLTLTAWFLPAPEGCASTVLVAPGNGGNRASRASLASALRDAGFGVLLLEYRGYGGNPGSPSEEGLARDARAAREFLLDAGVPAASTVYLGESLGGAVASGLAAEHPPAALVLRSPFTTLADAARAVTRVPLGWLLRDRFDVVEHVGRVSVPVAVVHGDADTTVPARLSRQVADASRRAGSTVVEVGVPGGGHNDRALASGPELMRAVVEVATSGGAAPCP